jgi:hypothetical protein
MGVWLDQCRIMELGPVDTVIKRYAKSVSE